MQPSVSVIIPTWNRAGRVCAAIESALSQSVPVTEVLVCDDGSTDDTEALVADMASRDPRVRWISGSRAGRPAVPRNRGIRESHGEWLAFLDSDDAWLPGKLQTQFDDTQHLSTLAACSNATRVDIAGRDKGVLLTWRRRRLTFADLLSVNQVVCSSCLVHRSLLAETGGFAEGKQFKAVEDYVLWLRIAALTDFAYCSDPLVHYRDDPGGSIRSTQDVPPEAQRKLVLAATGTWLLQAELGAGQRLSALASVAWARCRLSIESLTRRLRSGPRR